MTPDAAAQAARYRLLGILLMIGAVTCFVGLDTTAKHLGRTLPVMEVVWGRYLSALVLSLFIFNPVNRPRLLRTGRPMLQVVRAMLLVMSSVFNFSALMFLQLDQTIAIALSTPFLVAVLAGPLLGERIDARRWVAIAIGCLGATLVARPGLGGIHPAAILSVGAVTCTAFYMLSTRVLTRSDSNETLLFYSNAVGVAALSLIVPWVWVTPPDLVTLLLMGLVGAFGACGHYMLIVAHRLAPAGVVAPFLYTQIVSAVIIGYIVFGDLPDRWTLLGAGIVVASGLYLIYREGADSRQRTLEAQTAA